MADFKRYKISDMFGPDGNAYDKFSRENIPSKERFRQLFNSVLFSAESKHSANENYAGHVLLASAAEVKARDYTSDFTKVADVKMLPGLMLGDDTGYTIHGSAVSKNGLLMTEYTNDTTGAKDFMVDFLASSLFFSFDVDDKLVPNGTVAEGVYWGTAEGLTEIGFFPLVASNKVAVSGTSTADYLNSNQFQYVDNTVHVALKLSENKIWVGKDYGTYESVEEVATNNAFNLSFGFTVADVVEIGTALIASEIVVTDASKKIETLAMATGFNKALGTTAGTVSEGDHVHATFTTTVDGFVPAPGSILGKVLSDNGTWIEMAAASVPDWGYAPGEIVEISHTLGTSEIVVTDPSHKIYTLAKESGFNLPLGTVSGTISEGNHAHNSFTSSIDGFVPAPITPEGKFLMDNGTWGTISSSAETYMVKASSGDSSEGFLDAKVDNSSIYVLNNELAVKTNGIGLEEVNSSVLQIVEYTLTHSEIATLYSSPYTLVTCPIIVGQNIFIEVVDASFTHDIGDVVYTGEDDIHIRTETATKSQYYDNHLLTSTIDRSGFFTKQVPDYDETQLLPNRDVVLLSTDADPTSSGGTTVSLTVRVAYRIFSRVYAP